MINLKNVKINRGINMGISEVVIKDISDPTKALVRRNGNEEAREVVDFVIIDKNGNYDQISYWESDNSSAVDKVINRLTDIATQFANAPENADELIQFLMKTPFKVLKYLNNFERVDGSSGSAFNYDFRATSL